jgi:hypothetical protein
MNKPDNCDLHSKSGEPEEFTFANQAPEDKEWSAHIRLLNEWCTPERWLRVIIQYARSGPFYPADMHAHLIEQINDAHLQAAVRDTEARFVTTCFDACDEAELSAPDKRAVMESVKQQLTPTNTNQKGK